MYTRGVLTISFLLLNSLTINAEPLPIELSVNISNDRNLARRQVFGAPMYGGGCPGCCPACAPPLPPPPPPPPAPMPIPAPVPIAAAPPCPGFACAPPPLPLPPPPPVAAPAGRLIPQALPGAPCEPDNVECTGGSVCSMGICLCPPELVQEGTVCVSRTIYGVVPGVPPPPPPPVPAIPVAYPPAVPVAAPLAYPPPRPAFFDPCIIKRSAEQNVACKNQQ